MAPRRAAFVSPALTPWAAPTVAASPSAAARWAPRRAGARPCVTSVRRRPAAARRAGRTTPTAHDGCGSIWGDEPPLPAGGNVGAGGAAAAAVVAPSSGHCGHGHDHGHSHAHDHAHGHGAKHDDAAGGSAWSRLLAFVLEVREHLGVAIVGAGLLAVAVVAPAVGLPPAVAIAALGGSLALTGLPAVVASARTVVATRGRGTDVDVLMTLAAGAAIATGAPVEGALLTALYAGSHAAERAVTRKARGDLDALRALAPPTALRLPSADSAAVPTEVPLADVAVGDWLLVRAGEVAPADGTVASGSAFVSAEHLTGEAAPRAVAKGDPVPAGARAGDGALVLRVVRTGADSTVARISALVTEATRNRPAVTRLMDRFGVPYSRAVLIAALAVAVLLPFAPPPFRAPGWGGAGGSISRGLGVLVAASPCALVIGAPVAFLSSLSAAARRGVLVKGGAAALEAAATTATVAFDKTGTLTTGQLRLVGVDRFGDDDDAGDGEGYGRGGGGGASASHLSSLSRGNGAVGNGGGGWQSGSGAQAVAVAAALERNSVHPMATAILDRAAAGDVAPPPLDDFLTVPGHGLQGRMAGGGGGGGNGVADGAAGTAAAVSTVAPPSARVRFGRVPFVAAGRPGADADADADGAPAASDGFVSPAAAAWLEDAAAASSRRGESVAALGVEGVGATAAAAATGGTGGGEAYLFRFADAMRPEAAAGVAALKAAGLRVVMLTGDNAASAAAVAATVGGLDEVVASLTPAGKLDYVTAATAALAASPRGGRGDAGLLVVGDGINDAPALSAATVGVAVGLPTSSAAAAAAADVVLLRGAVTDVPWLVAKARSTRAVVTQNLVLALGLMALAVVPVTAGAIPLWQAVLLHEGSTVLVGLNGLRLLSDRLSSRF